MGFTQESLIEVHPSNVYLIEITKPVAYMPLDNYIQYASKGPGDRFYVSRKSRGCLSISAKKVKILAQCITYFPK